MCKGYPGPIQDINILYQHEVPLFPRAINLLKGIFGKKRRSKSIVCLICSSQLVIDGKHISVNSKALEVSKGFFNFGELATAFAYTYILSILGE